MMDGVFYYEVQNNYPTWDDYSILFYINKPINFCQKVVDHLKLYIDNEKCPYGNNRSPFDVRDLYLYRKQWVLTSSLLYVYFINLIEMILPFII